MSNALDNLVQRLQLLTPEQKKSVIDQAVAVAGDLKFIANPGPQTDAYFSDADVVLHGGQAGVVRPALSSALH
jgi:hypothetical protein